MYVCCFLFCFFLTNFGSQVHLIWWWCGRFMGWEHELSDGWQQAPHTCKWRADSFTGSLCPSVWGCSCIFFSICWYHCVSLTDIYSIKKHPYYWKVGDLQYASPATVSRCGMVFVDPKNLRYTPYWQKWLANRPGNVWHRDSYIVKSLVLILISNFSFC